MFIGEKQKTAITMLISGDYTHKEIANYVNVARRTIYNWEADLDFQAEYAKQLNEINRRIVRKAAMLKSKAVKRQEEILDVGGDRVAASVARDVLNRIERDTELCSKIVTIVNNIPDPETIRKGAAALLLEMNLSGDTKTEIMNELKRLAIV